MSHRCNPIPRAYPELGLRAGAYDTTLHLDRGTLATELAARYEQLRYWHYPQSVKTAAIARTMELFNAIPIPVVLMEGCEPFQSAEDMLVYIRQHGYMPVRYHGGNHAVFGFRFSEFRAVHDYYGHLLGLNAFTFQGEVRAYAVHAREYPREVLPAIWSNVVLENAYRVNRGHWLKYGFAGSRSKITCDPVQFPGLCT